MKEGVIKQISAAVIGAGAWGKVFAQILIDSGWAVHLWSREVGEIQDLPYGTLDMRKAVDGKDLVVLAVPCGAFRSVLPELKQFDLTNTALLSLAKGIETETLKRPSEIVKEILGEVNIAVLSGPNLAAELLQKLPAISVVGSKNPEIAKFLADQISNKYFHVRASGDVAGLEIAGTYKNILAIAIGLVRGAGKGENLAAAVTVAGLKEMLGLALKSGGQIATIYGPAGIGDLVATSSSGYSRNYSLGRLIAQKDSVEKAMEAAHQTIEGVKSTESIVKLGETLDVRMPIAKIIADMLAGKLTAKRAITAIAKTALK